MKKWTKVLSSFVVATVMGVGMATAVGCDGCNGDDDKGHTHHYTWVDNKDGTHKEHCDVDGCDAPDRNQGNHVDLLKNGTEEKTPDGLCDMCGAKVEGEVTPPDGGDDDETPEFTGTEIKTAADFVAFRKLGEIKEGDYTLEADIDLTGIALEAPSVVLTGTATFNGKGHIIQNATYSNAESKTGLFFKSVKGASVSDIKFLNCVVNSTSESVGILAGTAESGNKDDAENTKTVISKIEFNSCNIKGAGNYGGLLYGRNENAAFIEISEITTKNGCSVMRGNAQYGGFLTGSAKGTTVKMTDLDLDGEVEFSSNGSFFAGRVEGTSSISIENAVIRKAKLSNLNNNGLFIGGGIAGIKLDVKNVLIVDTNATHVCKAQTGREPVMTYEKVYSVGEEAKTLLQSAVADPAKDLVTELAENSVATLKNTLALDFTNTWMEEGEGLYRLKAASTNVKSADAKLTSIKVNASNAKVRYKVGEEFSSEGILVMGVYSDGVQLVLAETTGFTVDVSGIDFSKADNYKVTVNPVNSDGENAQAVQYDIVVAAQTGIKVYQDRMSHVYLVGEKTLDTKNMSVKSTWTDGLEETLAEKDYNITDYDLTTAGDYTAKVKNGNFDAVDVKISVVNHIPVAAELGKVYVNVDKTQTAAVKIDKGIATFKSITDAVKYLEYSDLSEDVTKVIYIGEGTYNEHIKTSLKNLTLIGKGKDKTIITASNVQSTINPLTDAMFGLKENATLIVLGDKFQARGLAIRNDFDYPNKNKEESGPQGTALMIGGDQSIISDCLLYGHQDTLYLSNGRVYIKDTEIQGNIDFIFGEATGFAYFDNCTIKAINKSATEKGEKNNGYVTAMKADATNKPDYGYIFSKCHFTDDGKVRDGSMSLGRPWGAAATVAFLECDFSAAYSTLAYGALEADGKTQVKPRWYDMSGNSPVNADFVEWKSTGAGAITEEVNGGKILTDEQAASYTIANIFAKSNGLKEWAAAWTTYEADLAALVAMDTATVAPDTSEFVYFFDGDTDETTGAIKLEVNKTAIFEATIGPWNSNDKEISVEVADPTIAKWDRGVLTGIKAGNTKIVVSRTGMDSLEIPVTVTAPASTEQTVTKTLDFSTLDSTGVAADSELALGDFFTVTGNAKKENAKITGAGYAADGLTFDSQISLTKGKVSTTNNGVKFTIDKEAKIVVYAAEKSDKTTKLSVIGSDGNAATITGLKIDGVDATAFNQLPIDKVSKYEFTLAAGTYHIGGAGGGAYIYGLNVSMTISSGVVQAETKTLDFSTLDSTGVAADGELALGDFFTVTGNAKKENAKITGAGYAADGLTFDSQISLTKGKVSTTNNGVKFTIDKEAKIVVYAAEKSDKTTKLSVIGSDGNAATIMGLKIDGVDATAFNQLPIDKVSKYEFTLAAGTYHIGGAGGGAYIYGMTVTF